MEDYDVIVIGSGGGMKVALPAAQKGLKTAFIEKGALGGTCLNRGCIPSKMMIYPADLMYEIEQAARVDIKVHGRTRIDFPNMVTRISQTVDGISAKLRDMVSTKDNLDFYDGAAMFKDNHVIAVNQKLLRGKQIFIATGSIPQIPAIDGLADTPYMTSTEALRNVKLPDRLIVIGGGYIACEIGGAYQSFGCDTHFLVRSELMRTADADVRHEFQQQFQQRHQVHQGYLPMRVDYRGNRFHVAARHVETFDVLELKADALLIATGVQPATADLGLAQTDVKLSADGFIQVDDYLQTDVDGVYALGDCVGNYFFRHTVNTEGEYLVRSALERSDTRPLDYGPVPYAVFTAPEIAGVGQTEDALKRAGVTYLMGRSDYADCNMGMARQIDHGFCKLLFTPQGDKILGAHIIGPQASVLIQTVVAVMRMNGGLDDLLNMIYIHPALPELIRDTAREAACQRAASAP